MLPPRFEVISRARRIERHYRFGTASSHTILIQPVALLIRTKRFWGFLSRLSGSTW